jgi:hypothetical protein
MDHDEDDLTYAERRAAVRLASAMAVERQVSLPSSFAAMLSLQGPNMASPPESMPAAKNTPPSLPLARLHHRTEHTSAPIAL